MKMNERTEQVSIIIYCISLFYKDGRLAMASRCLHMPVTIRQCDIKDG